MTKKVALIDADSIIYKAGCANETRWYVIKRGDLEVHRCNYKKEADAYMKGDPGLTLEKTKEVGPLKDSLSNTRNLMESILDNYPCDEYRVFIGGHGNFRDYLYPEYKMHRDPTGKPIHEPEIRQYLTRTWKAEEVHDEEADDKVSYIQCSDLNRYCIVGVDKDLWNTPGEHFNYGTGVIDFVEHAQANRNFWKQMLTGDASDNIPGLEGVGPKTADKILKGKTTGLAKEVLHAYRQHSKTRSYFICMGRLLWLRRKPEEYWNLNIMRGYEVPG